MVDKTGKSAYDMGNAVMRHAMIHAGRDKPKISKRQQQALAMASKVAKEKAKQQEDLIKAQEAQLEAAAEVNRRKNEEYQLRIEAAREKRELRVRHLEDAKKRRDEKRDVVAIARAEMEAHRLKLEEDTKRIIEDQERKWQEHLERENGVERAKRLIQNQDIILLIKAFFNKNCRIGHMRAAHISERLVMNFNVRGLEHLYRMYGTGELEEKREKMEISMEEYALMELEFPWVAETLLRDGEVRVTDTLGHTSPETIVASYTFSDMSHPPLLLTLFLHNLSMYVTTPLGQIRVESILSNGVVGKETLEVPLNKPGHTHNPHNIYTHHTHIHTRAIC